MNNTPEYIQSELPAIQLFQKLGYDYFDAHETDPRTSINEVVLEERLRAALTKINPWLNGNALEKVVRKLTTINESTLMEANQELFRLITKKDAITVKPENSAKHKPVFAIDYENIENNDFLIVNQMKYHGKQKNSIPDIVVYINGLPLVTIEAKSPKVTITDAVDDLIYYQGNSPKLFHYNQICLAINKNKALYGTIHSQFEHYSKFREDDTTELEKLVENKPTAQDILIYSLFAKEILLDIIRNFTIFELDEGRTIKKLPRYQQKRAVNKILEKLSSEKEGGVVWHTQGSGKSITMVYLATKLRREEAGFDNPTILVVTDRVDLDSQIHKTFKNAGFPDPQRASSIDNLKEQLRNSYGKTLMTTIHKFQEKAESAKGEVEILSNSENVFVLIDEAHRSQYGMTAAYMRSSLPNAKFIAFTGTPIDREEKSTLREFYGGDYIDKYTIKESVADGNTLAIRYQTGIAKYFIEKDLMDEQFKAVFEGVAAPKMEYLTKQGSRLSTLFCAKRRVEEIAKDIITHYREKIYKGNRYKAMLVCHNRKQAIAYQKAFLKLKEQGLCNFDTKVVMSFNTKKDPAEYRELAVDENEIKNTIENFKLPFGDESDKTAGGNRRYDNTAILIVSDMLLTGYDAPIVQCMYIDKLLKEHTLLQAIARVNRTRQGKSYGLVVDYAGITEYLTDALKIFSGDLGAGDVMTNIENEKTILDNRHAKIVAFFNHIKINPKNDRNEFVNQCVEFLEAEDRRDSFVELVKKFNQSMDIVLPDEFAINYQYDLKLYNDIKLEAVFSYTPEKMTLSRDDSKKIQMIIDEHLRASGVEYLLEEAIDITDSAKFEEQLATKGGKTKELTIANRIKHTIAANGKENPEFYEELSKRLAKLIKDREDERIDQAELLFGFAEIQEEIKTSTDQWRAIGLSTPEQFPIYLKLDKHLKEPKSFTLGIFNKVAIYLTKDDWFEHSDIKKTIRKEIKSLLRSCEDIDKEALKILSAEILEILENRCKK